MAIWLANMDLKLTEVEHFSEMNICAKMRQLQVHVNFPPNGSYLLKLSRNKHRFTCTGWCLSESMSDSWNNKTSGDLSTTYEWASVGWVQLLIHESLICIQYACNTPFYHHVHLIYMKHDLIYAHIVINNKRKAFSKLQFQGENGKYWMCRCYFYYQKWHKL